MIHPTRFRSFGERDNPNGEFVLYWMQQSVRSTYNHALEFAIEAANDQQMGLVVLFGITDNYPEANERHYKFLLEGLQDTQARLAERGIPLIIHRASPDQAAIELSQRASLLVMDRGYLRVQRYWRKCVIEQAHCSVVQVESDVVVPVETASGKEEWTAATLRPKLHRLLQEYLLPLPQQKVEYPILDCDIPSWQIDDIDLALSQLDLDRSVKPVSIYIGGETEARRRLMHFVEGDLEGYATRRNDPAANRVSHLSPYLHFGHISPLEIALEVSKHHSQVDIDAFLEDLIVRRELSMNFVYFNPDYDKFGCLPDWAKMTLAKHAKDVRDYNYSRTELEGANTHDPYWNAAQMEMVLTGKMHGYMRMYWGKKIIEWSNTPENAFNTALYLNNRYFLDGRDANSYAGVAWCFGKHDRPWGERKIFGMVRYMNAAGLKRKFDIDGYLRIIEGLAGRPLSLASILGGIFTQD
ncbi:MAG: deoxyribodipyrimidine photo-lyase [Chthonomonadales bacterium]